MYSSPSFNMVNLTSPITLHAAHPHMQMHAGIALFWSKSQTSHYRTLEAFLKETCFQDCGAHRGRGIDVNCRSWHCFFLKTLYGRGEGGSRRREYIYIYNYDWFALLYSRNHYNTVNQLSSNLKFFLKIKKKQINKEPLGTNGNMEINTLLPESC